MNADMRLRLYIKGWHRTAISRMGFREALASRSLPVGVAPMGQLPLGVWVRMAERSKALRSSWGTIVRLRWGRREEEREGRKREGEEEKRKMKKREGEI